MNFWAILIATIILEFLVYLIFIRKDFLYLLPYSILINSFTNPLANLAYSYGNNIYLIELLVFLVEIFLIKLLLKTSWKKAIIISFVANLISFLAGLALMLF